ncbi:hypothetical protein ACEE78_11465 [Staphylococcus hyicus]
MKTVETKFIIEVNEGMYLRINRSEGSCTLTENPNRASAFLVEGNPTAEKYAEKCGGKLKRFTATYEVED